MGLLNINRFRNLHAMIGAWPITVWEFDPANREEREIKKLIGDTEDETTRENVFQPDDPGGKRRYEMTVSIFSPTLASVILNLYAPKDGGVCFDPFAGGGTRMIMASNYGLQYVGIELRAEECDALIAKAKKTGLTGIDIIEGSSCDEETYKGIEEDSADFLLTCPPYYDLEKYNGGDKDLSMLGTYDEFLEQIRVSVRMSKKVLKKDAISCWVVGLMRDKKGELLFMNHDIIRLHREEGFFVKEEVVVYPKTSGALTRSNMFLKGNKNLVRVHQYCLVFQNR